MFCKTCGSEVDPRANYCNVCGNPIEHPKDRAVESVSAICDGTPSMESIINEASESIKDQE